MTIRPIIFSEAMVQAMLAGRKTQTRRLSTSPLRRAEKGDRLWVRESGKLLEYAFDHDPASAKDIWSVVGFRHTADGAVIPFDAENDPGGYIDECREANRPSIHMPRWASRLTLKVTRVRYERLTCIDGIDAIAEGITRVEGQAPWRTFKRLWNTLHTKPGERWEDNPMVVALTFEVIHGNVDEVIL